MVVGIWIPGWSLITRVVTTVIATLTAGLLAWLLIPWIQEQATTQVVASVERGVRNVWKQLHHERLSLTFDNSPLFTRARRDRITEEWSAFYHYLDGVGFDLPKDVPPLKTTPGGAINMSWTSPSVDASAAQISIPEQWLDNPEKLRSVYGAWIFRKLFGLVDNPPWLETRSQMLHASTSLFSCYYRSSFSNENVCDHDWVGRKWNNRLWDMRVKKQQVFTDRVLLATYKSWAWTQTEPPAVSFDDVFCRHLTYGLSLINPVAANSYEDWRPSGSFANSARIRRRSNWGSRT